MHLVDTTHLNSTFRAHWLASLVLINQVLLTPVLSARFEEHVGVSLLLAPTGADWRGPKAPFPLVENAGIQLAICKKSTRQSSGRSQVLLKALFTSKQPKKNKMAFVGILSQIKLLFRPLVIHLVWYIHCTKTIIHLSVSESGGYLPRRFAARLMSTTIHFHFGE